MVPSKRCRIEPLKQLFQQCSRQHARSPPDVRLSTKQVTNDITLLYQTFRKRMKVIVVTYYAAGTVSWSVFTLIYVSYKSVSML